MSEQEEYIEIRNKLKNLPAVKASENFENLLKQKINIAEAEIQTAGEPQMISPEKKKNLFDKIFVRKTNYWLIPALGTVVVVFIFFIIYNPYRKTELVPSSTTTQRLTDGEVKPPAPKTETLNEGVPPSELKSSNQDLSPTKPEVTKESEPVTREKADIERIVTKSVPELVSPKSETIKQEAQFDKMDKSGNDAPVLNEQEKIEMKTVDESKSEAPAIDQKKEDVNIRGGRSTENQVIIDGREKDATKKDKKISEKKSETKKTNKAVSDSANTVIKQLEKIRDTILEKEKNK